MSNNHHAESQRNLFLTGNIEESNTNKIIEEIIKLQTEDNIKIRQAKIDEVEYKVKPINLYISSFGGLAHDALGLISVMKSSPTPIHTYVTGKAMSAGSLISICGHKRFAYEYSTFMFHELSTGAWGELTHLKDRIEESDKLQKVLDSIILKHTKFDKKTYEKYKRELKNQYLNSKEALKLGVIDEIL